MKVIAFATLSLDGRITRADEQGTSYSSPENISRFLGALDECDVVIFGRRTYEAVKEMMSAVPAELLSLIMTRTPERFADEAVPRRLEFTSRGPEEIVADMQARGKAVVGVAGGSAIYTAFAGLIEEWQVTVEPVLLGAGIPLLTDLIDHELRLTEHRLLNTRTIFLRYDVVRA